MRLNKFLVLSGVIDSRRKADRLIEHGLITVDGRTAHLGKEINPDLSKVYYGKKLLKIENREYKYIAFYKPKGYICSHRKFKGQRSIISILPEGINWRWAGRLDKNSEGLILVSDDGFWINKVTHPSYQVLKEYLIELDSDLTNCDRDKLIRGINIKGKRYRAIKLNGQDREWKMAIISGYKRQIREMLGILKIEVLKLVRIKHGIVEIGKLKPGCWKKLKYNEINFFLKLERKSIKYSI